MIAEIADRYMLKFMKRPVFNMQKRGVNMAKRKEKGRPAKPSILSGPQRRMADLPYLELKGNREALIEGCKGILQYDTQIIRINTGAMIIAFCGRGLNIKCLTVSSLIVEGYITSVEFVS